MRPVSVLFAVLAGFAVLTCPVAAQEADTGKAQAAIEQAGAAVQDLASAKPDPSTLRPEGTCSPAMSDDVRQSCEAANAAYYSYYVFGLEHRKNVFIWQDISTKVIFAVVIALVVIGVWFAWLQFRRGMQEAAEVDQANHTVEIGTKGVKVSSPVLGVIILTLSLGFFYLYLIYVYPIVDTI